jgi:tungstate transport system ATP-binding protein
MAYGPAPSAQGLPLDLDRVRYAVAGKVLLNDVTLTIAQGPRTVVLGPNGAGKSLLLRLCHGLIAPTAGTIRRRSQAGSAVESGKPLGAMVFQRPVLLRRSARANIAYALSLTRLDRAEADARVEAALALFGLTEIAHRPARVLSGGEQQRVALARAWVLRPSVLFLDEPTASLDPGATRAVEAAVGAFYDAGTTIVMTTHDLGQAKRLADEIVFLASGRLVERTPARAFFDGPRSPEARAFLAGDLLW